VSFEFIKRVLRSLPWPSPPHDPRLRLGRRGERWAARTLKRQRHRILARNFRCRAGEIDLITLFDETLVFVEVKSRSSDDRADPAEAVNRDKWERIGRAARVYLMTHRTANRSCRFDLITIVWPPQGRPRVEHYEDAYQPKWS